MIDEFVKMIMIFRGMVQVLSLLSLEMKQIPCMLDGLESTYRTVRSPSHKYTSILHNICPYTQSILQSRGESGDLDLQTSL